jgi:hypothetical protein
MAAAGLNGGGSNRRREVRPLSHLPYGWPPKRLQRVEEFPPGHLHGGPEVRFGVPFRNDNRERTPPLARLRAPCETGDQGEPVLTVLLPAED